jgi:hypothetical protein
MDNKILDYINDIIYFQRHNDKEGMEALIREGEAEHVTLKDVGFAFIDIMDDFTAYVDASQGLTEVRLRAIVEGLDEKAISEIHKKFKEAEDDLFLAEGEE